MLYNKIDQLIRATTYSESLFVEIKLKDKDLVIGVMYRHQNCTFTVFQNDFTQILNTLSHLKKEYIICGDINIDTLKSQNSPAIKAYIDKIYAEG